MVMKVFFALSLVFKAGLTCLYWSSGLPYKRSAGTDCEGLAQLEEAAFAECESDGADGLTWDEVEKCEAKFPDFEIPLPTFADFKEFDLNNDGILFIQEWIEKTNC